MHIFPLFVASHVFMNTICLHVLFSADWNARRGFLF
uniref:Uncharacterized protein n=1 Tax=Rhizophora mucronata TaxID=61149 RepID=A0A2P2NCE3_RHIMU